MVCQYCKNPIGPIRVFYDRQFCCRSHRVAFHAKSARELRRMGELRYAGLDPLEDTDEIPAARRKKGAVHSGAKSAATAAGIAMLAVAALVVMERTGMTSSAPPPAGTYERPEAVGSWIGAALNKLPQGNPARVFEDEFSRGFRSWMPAPGTGSGAWSAANGLIRPGGLRIWESSRNLADYRFQFEGRIDHKAMGWVVRAPNHKNYYAAKLQLPARGSSARAEIVRFSMVQGQESRRQHMPVPVTIAADTFYNFEVKTFGDKIVTLVNGQVVDSWRDSRFPTGGVGFFNERGERSSIKWARLTEGETMVDKLKSYLTFGLVLPQL
jgi:hypothetical protein